MNQPALVTLVDPDPRGLATLTYSFEKEHFTVAGTSDPGMASQLIRATGARLIVISLRPPERALLDLVADLRRQSWFANLAIVALGPPGSRQAARDAGAFDYLDTPVLVRDAIVVSRLWLGVRPGTITGRDAVPERPAAAGRAAATERAAATAIEGSLEALHGLYFVIRAMNATGRSGVLQLARGNRKGEVRFSDGAVTSAQLRGLQAFPALHQLLLWSGADLSLELRDVPRRAQFSANGIEILEECERFLRDVTHAARQLGSLQTTFGRDARHGDPLAAGIPQEVAPVARLFDGVRTLGGVLEDSPFRIFDTLRAVKQLVDSGAVMVRSGAVVPGAPQAIVPRGRTQSGAQTLSRTQSPPRDLDALLHDRRGGSAGERRRTAQRTPSGFEKPAAKPAPAPIPLVSKKSPSGAFAMGDLRSSARATRLTPQRPPPAIPGTPSVHLQVEAPPLSLDASLPSGAVMAPTPAAPAPAPARAPVVAPVAAPAPAPAPAPVPAPAPAPMTARQPSTQLRPKKSSKTPVPGAPAFNALEADFFAREADLYKHDAGDSFDDLDHGGDAKPGTSHTSPPRGSRSGKKK